MLSTQVSTTIAQIACFDNSLPQGAPSSPIISEFIAQNIDYRLQRLARKLRCSYSRYADDLTFSTNLKSFPNDIAMCDPISGAWQPGLQLLDSVNRAGFSLNNAKTRMQLRHERQSVTGLTVNMKANVGQKYYKGIRYCAHSMMTTGHAFAKPALSIKRTTLNSNQILGMLQHVHDIKGRALKSHALRDYRGDNKPPHHLRLMADYYHYHRIHISKRPLLVCEGKTDYIYIKESIFQKRTDPRVGALLIDHSKYPKTAKSGSAAHCLIDFVRHTNAANNFMDLAGGGSNLIKFCKHHLDRAKKYHANPNSQPVIVVVDNDPQSAAMWSFIKTETRSAENIDGSAPYYKLWNNLYIVPIPKLGAGDYYIEKLLPEKWLQKDLDGRKLKLVQKKGEKLKPDEYGKGELATKVIIPNSSNIDFSNFLPLLHSMCDIIEGKPASAPIKA